MNILSRGDESESPTGYLMIIINRWANGMVDTEKILDKVIEYPVSYGSASNRSISRTKY